MSAKFAKDGQTVNAYRANTVFITLYALRLAFFVIGGLALLLMAYNNDDTADYFCSRYYGI